jgi:hypothetical protein
LIQPCVGEALERASTPIVLKTASSGCCAPAPAEGRIMITRIEHPTRILFFTGKGGVRRTSADRVRT